MVQRWLNALNCGMAPTTHHMAHMPHLPEVPAPRPRSIARTMESSHVVVASPSYTELSNGTGTVDSTPATVSTVTVTLAAPVLAEDIGNVSVIISG